MQVCDSSEGCSHPKFIPIRSAHRNGGTVKGMGHLFSDKREKTRAAIRPTICSCKDLCLSRQYQRWDQWILAVLSAR